MKTNLILIKIDTCNLATLLLFVKMFVTDINNRVFHFKRINKSCVIVRSTQALK